jgi:hypothetical protein
LYTKALFGEKDRQQANELIANIRQMFAENLNQMHWIDEASKAEAEKKLKKISEKVGYPDFINNKTKLNERSVAICRSMRNSFVLLRSSYIGFSMVEQEYFNNGMKVVERERRRSLLKFGQKVDLAE